MKQDEQTRRISFFEEGEGTRRLELPRTPLWDVPAVDREPRGKHGKHTKRFLRRWPMAVVVGLIGLALGVVGTLLVTGTALQRTVADRDVRIAQLTSQIGQERAEQRRVSARRAELDQRGRDLDQREIALGQREGELDQRAAALDQRDQELDRREAVPARRAPPPSIDRPDDKPARGMPSDLGQRIQDILADAMSGN
ncbi:MAG: hypothetical protein ACRDYA_19390 [Egibacteraceae bacterium]